MSIFDALYIYNKNMDNTLQNFINRDTCYFIHYASDGFYNGSAPAPRISCIIISNQSNNEYLSRHPEFEQFMFPKTFYFRYLPDRNVLHWAIIKEVANDDKRVNIYFINNWGRVFDKLEYKNIKIARRKLRKNGFDFSTNRYCPYTPPEPIYINLSYGKKSAPYSKGNLWQSVQRGKQNNKKEQTYNRQQLKWYEYYLNGLPQHEIGQNNEQQNNDYYDEKDSFLIVRLLVGILMVGCILLTILYNVLRH